MISSDTRTFSPSDRFLDAQATIHQADSSFGVWQRPTSNDNLSVVHCDVGNTQRKRPDVSCLSCYSLQTYIGWTPRFFGFSNSVNDTGWKWLETILNSITIKKCFSMLDTRLSCCLKIKFFSIQGFRAKIISSGTNLQPANLQSNIYYWKYITLLFNISPYNRHPSQGVRPSHGSKLVPGRWLWIIK